MLTLTSPVETWAHGLPAGLKLGALALATTGLFALSTPSGLALAMLGALALIATGGAGFAGAVLRLLKPLWPFVVVVGVWHAWTGDLPGGIVILLRLATAVILANSITMTTSLSEMIAVFQWLARPFAVVGLSPRRLALALALAVRFIPVMLDHLARITEAWAARSPRRPRWRVVVPATLAALDDAERAAEALRARGGAD